MKMIKEKHEKNSDSSKDDPVNSEKDSTNSEVRIKKEDDITIKKEPTGCPITKNGGLVGSTNTGSLQITHTSTDLKSEISCDDSVNTTVSDATSLPLKQEDNLESDNLNDPFGLGLGPPTSGPGSHPPQSQPDSVQPLGSNVINKQSSSMEVQYMQQQSQIFVFSTVLANSGADEVIQGRYPSIIAYHCAQPGTKKFLEKNPLKIAQFNRHPAQWLNNLTMIKNKGCTRSPNLGMKPPTTIESFLGTEGLEEMVGLNDTDSPWDQKNNHHLDATVANGLPDMGPDMDSCSPLLNIQPKLQGVQVPDENLTPQQRQHREERLASLKKMQQLLFPDSSEGPPSDSMPGMPSSNAPLGGPGSVGVPPVSAHLDWQKIQFYDDRTKMKGQPPPGNISSCSSIVPVGPVSGTCTQSSMTGVSPSNPRGIPGLGPRLQGPPPPYHQTQRSASVPIALQSPNPTSPNNPTSNLSLPSPRASSALNSPADSNRPFGNLTRHMSTGQSPTSQDSPSAPRLIHSNPSTPLSAHLSPSVTNSSTEPSTTHQSSDSMFGRALQSIAQQISTSTTSSCPTVTATGAGKEPNLMPVPSPQQIQYLNAFEGQELIIQKQPNTSLKEDNIISPPVLPTSIDNNFPGTTPDLPHARISGSNTPNTLDRFASTPGVTSDGCRFQVQSPHTPPAGGNIKPTHVDPISCLAQMSQQLTNNVANSLNGQSGQGPPMMNFGSPSMHMMDMGSCHGGMVDLEGGNMMGVGPMQGPPHGFHPGSPMGHMRSLSPKLPGAFPNHMPIPRMMGRAPGPSPFNGANVQVKPNAPNTIQYLPAKGQGVGGPAGPRGPPSLEFLSRLAPPMNMMDNSKMQPGQYFQNCGPGVSPGPMQGSPMGHMEENSMIGSMGGHIGNGNGAPMMGGPGSMPMGSNGPGPGGMMPMIRGGPGMRPLMRVPQMGYRPSGPVNDNMFPGPGTPMGPGSGAQMFVAGPKSSPMGMAPDASQPLPPSMGQSGGFKGAPFVGPSTSDPNYAQHYYNFQQQLYATNTRSQMGAVAQSMGPGPGPPHMQEPSYFNPK